jgi:hypothetical protein
MKDATIIRALSGHEQAIQSTAQYIASQMERQATINRGVEQFAAHVEGFMSMSFRARLGWVLFGRPKPKPAQHEPAAIQQATGAEPV